MRVSNVTVRKRLIFILISGILIFTIIDIRLGYVQFFLGNMLTDRAKDSWSRNITFEPERGKILDRNGVELATNKSAQLSLLYRGKLKNGRDCREVSCSIRCGKR